MSDFDILRNLNQQDAPGGLAQEEVIQMLTALQKQVGTQQKQIDDFYGLQGQQVATDKAQGVPMGPTQVTTKIGPDGQTTVSLSGLTPDQVQYYQQAAQFYQQALGGFAQEANYIRAQEERARSQPWQQLATALSANLAQAKDMPGWVQALGRTSAQLNPTVDQLQARRLAVLGQGAQIAEKGMAMGIAEERTRNELAIKMMEMGDKERKEVETMGGKLVAQIRLATRQGEAPSPETVANAVALIDPEGKLPKEAVDRAVQLASGLAGTSKKALDVALARKQTLAKTVSDLALQRGIDLTKATYPIKLSLMREAFTVTHGKEALQWEQDKRMLDNQLNVALAQAKATGVIDTASMGMLRAGQGTNIYVGSLDNMLKIPEIASAAEPAFLVDRNKDGTVKEVRFNPEAVLPQAWKSIPRTEAENMIAHEMPRILALLFKQGVGAQMFRSAKGVELLNSLGVSNHIRVDQMQAILENIRHTNNLSNFAPVVMTKFLDWKNDPNLAAMAGIDDPKNAPFWEGMDQFRGKIPVRFPTVQGAAPAATGPDPLEGRTATGPNGEKLVRRGGKWVPQ